MPCFAMSKATKKNKDLPNILVIVIDDMGYSDMSFLSQSSDDVSTPAIDKLAKNGTYFTNAYSTCPVCSPARAGLITGRYQQRWGNYWYAEGGLPKTELTIPQALKKYGYISKKIGKTHLNGGPAEHPLDHGFDEFLGFIHHTWDYLRLSKEDVQKYGEANAKKATIGPLIRNREKVYYQDAYTTDIFTDETIEFIERDRGGKPFYAELEYNAVHHPTYVCHPDYLEKFGIEQFPFWNPEKEGFNSWHKKWGHLGKVDPNGRKRYLLQLAVLDDGIKKIMDSLEKTGQLDNTIVILTSDNGGTINTYSENKPLRGFKYMFGEGGIRVPLIVSYPTMLPKNSTNDALVSLMDIFPTVVDFTGNKIPENLDGKSLLPLMQGKRKTQHDFLCWADGRGAKAVRKGNWKLCIGCEWEHLNYKIVDGKCVKDPIKYKYPGGTQLFNLKEDIAETTNRADENPQLVKQLKQIFDNWRKQMSDPVETAWY